MGANVSGLGDTQRVLDAFRRIVQALRESSRAAEQRVGLTGAQLFVLQSLAESPGRSVNELAERTHTHQSSVSVVVKRLEEQGLVRRSPSAVDGRCVELTLSTHGRRVAERAPDPAQARLIAAIEGLTPSRRRQLASTLGDVAQALSTTDAAPAMFFEERHPRVKKAARE